MKGMFNTSIGLAMAISVFGTFAQSCADGAAQGVQIAASGASSSNMTVVDDCAAGPCSQEVINIKSMASTGTELLQGTTGVSLDWVVTAVSAKPARRVLLKVDNPPSGLPGQLTSGAPIYRVQGVPSVIGTSSMNATARDLSRCERDLGAGKCNDLTVAMAQYDTQRSVSYSINQGVGTTSVTTPSIWSTVATSMLSQLFAGTGSTSILTGIFGTTGTTATTGTTSTSISHLQRVRAPQARARAVLVRPDQQAAAEATSSPRVTGTRE